MGLDLHLLPFYAETANFSHTLLETKRAYDQYDEIAKCPQQPVDPGFHSYYGRHPEWDDVCYGVTEKTPYGEPVKWTRAKYLKPHLTGPAGAYIRELDDEHKIALYWH